MTGGGPTEGMAATGCALCLFAKFSDSSIARFKTAMVMVMEMVAVMVSWQ